MRALLRARWPPILAGLATLAYAVGVLAFGLVYRPLHHDEGVTLQVAEHASARQVLDVAVNYRHGPPLHYLLVHVSLLWHNDVFGLRLPSALLGILAVAVAYGFGRELLGRQGGALVALITAASPIVVHLGQFSRGYTAMLAAVYGSLWLMLVLVRTRRAVLVAPYAVTALLLVSAHPFGLFALLSELVLLALLGVVPLLSEWQQSRRALVATGTALVLGMVALVALQRLYAPLQSKYGVGSGGPVLHLGSSGFWDRLGSNASGSSVDLAAVALGVAVLVGTAAMARGNRRGALVVVVWLVLPLGLLAVLTAQSSDFAPERHLSFLLPGAALAVAAAVLAVTRTVPGRGRWLGPALAVALLAPGAVADINDLRNFEPDLRDAGLYLESRFSPADVLLGSAGQAERGADPRLYAAYAVLEAPEGSPLGRWSPVGDATGCTLVQRLAQRPDPDRAWLLIRPSDPAATEAALRAGGVQDVHAFGAYLVAETPVPLPGVAGSLRAGAHMFRAAAGAGRDARAFGLESAQYRLAAAFQRAGVCS